MHLRRPAAHRKSRAESIGEPVDGCGMMGMRSSSTCVVAVLLLSAASASLRPPTPRVSALRGGSTFEAEAEEDPEAGGGEADETEARRAWLLEQVRRRQERVLVLSRALAERGLPFGDGRLAARASGIRIVEAPDWVCAVSSPGKPRSCLIWGDAEDGCAVVRPRKAGAQQWVTLSALNGLRRTEPAKASALWYDKYALDLRRFNAEAGPVAALLGAALDSRRAVRSATWALLAVAAAVLRKPAAFLAVQVATSPLAWKHYSLWSPVVHAPLPLKLLLGRQLWVYGVDGFRLAERAIRNAVVILESRALEAGVSADFDGDDE